MAVATHGFGSADAGKEIKTKGEQEEEDEDMPPLEDAPPLVETVNDIPSMRGFWHTWTPPSERAALQVPLPPQPPAPALIPQRGPLPPTCDTHEDPMDLCDVD
jgi:hypothetical protein